MLHLGTIAAGSSPSPNWSAIAIVIPAVNRIPTSWSGLDSHPRTGAVSLPRQRTRDA
ncbi:hypothetical protein ACVIGA_008591 [Bradyrhizobium sp. USDA 3240]